MMDAVADAVAQDTKKFLTALLSGPIEGTARAVDDLEQRAWRCIAARESPLAVAALMKCFQQSTSNGSSAWRTFEQRIGMISRLRHDGQSATDLLHRLRQGVVRALCRDPKTCVDDDAVLRTVFLFAPSIVEVRRAFTKRIQPRSRSATKAAPRLTYGAQPQCGGWLFESRRLRTEKRTAEVILQQIKTNRNQRGQ